MTLLRRGAVTIETLEAGDGPPVVLVHSTGMPAGQWRRLMADLAAVGRRAIAVNLRGYGATTPWPSGGPFAFDDEIEVLRAAIDHAGGRADLVGHSYGALLALKLACARPKAVGALVLIEPVAFSVADPEERAEMDDLADALVGLVRAGDPDEALRLFVDYWTGKGAWEAFPPERRAAWLGLAEAIALEVEAIRAETASAGDYARVEAPTLLLAGASTRRPAAAVFDRLKSALPGVEAVRLEGAGHMLPLTHAAEVDRMILGHLARHPLG